MDAVGRRYKRYIEALHRYIEALHASSVTSWGGVTVFSLALCLLTLSAVISLARSLVAALSSFAFSTAILSRFKSKA